MARYISKVARKRLRYSYKTQRWYQVGEHFLTTIPRAGIWNRKSCNRWVSEGCWPMSTFVNDRIGQTRRIVGYDSDTDSLILGETLQYHDLMYRINNGLALK